MSDLLKQLDDLASEFSLPSITEWQQGKFIDGPQYSHMGEKWKAEQEAREETLIRPGGGTNNALFQVRLSAAAPEIAEYLEELGRILKEYCNEN